MGFSEEPFYEDGDASIQTAPRVSFGRAGLMRRLLLPLLAALALVWPAAAAAEERILHYLSDVLVQADGALDVTETIRVRSEGALIDHGIYRDFPTRYTNRAGAQVRVGFEVLSVQRDGADEPWHSERQGNGVRVYMGARGNQRARRASMSIRSATAPPASSASSTIMTSSTGTPPGNGWVFPIDVAEARIRLPQPVPFGQRAVYTGPQGSTGRECGGGFRGARARSSSEPPRRSGRTKG